MPRAPPPLEKGEQRPLVDTIGYSIQTCWLLQFLMKPLRSSYMALFLGCTVPSLLVWDWNEAEMINVEPAVCNFDKKVHKQHKRSLINYIWPHIRHRTMNDATTTKNTQTKINNKWQPYWTGTADSYCITKFLKENLLLLQWPRIKILEIGGKTIRPKQM